MILLNKYQPGRNSMKNLFLIAVLLLSPSLLFAEPKEIRIGLLVELSGQFATGSGDQCKYGYELGKKMYAYEGDHYKVKFIYGDSQGDPKASINEFNRLVNVEKVNAVITNRSQVGMALNPLSIRHKVPLIGIVGHAEFVNQNPYAFRFWPNTKDEASTLAKKVHEMGFKDVAIVTQEDEWMISYRDSFIEYFEKVGGKIKVNETISPSMMDFRAVTSRIKNSKASTVVINLGPANTGVFIKRLREQGVDQQLFGGYYTRTKESIQNAGEAIEGLILVELDLDKPNFVKVVEQELKGELANTYKFTCASAIAFVLDALKNNNEVTDSNSLFGALNDEQELKLADGTLIIKDREAQFDLAYKVIREGKVVNFQS